MSHFRRGHLDAKSLSHMGEAAEREQRQLPSGLVIWLWTFQTSRCDKDYWIEQVNRLYSALFASPSS